MICHKFCYKVKIVSLLCVLPIGFDMEQQKYDYSMEHQPRLEAASKMKFLLCEGIRRRGWTKSTRLPLSMKPLEMYMSQKRAADISMMVAFATSATQNRHELEYLVCVAAE